MDSELVVNQMNKNWRLKNDNLRELFHAVMDKQRAFNEVIYQHQKRENPKIKKVDRLAKEALEGK